MQLVTQKEVTAGRNVAGNNVNDNSQTTYNTFNIAQAPQVNNQLSILYERLRSEVDTSSSQAQELIEDLQHYVTRPAKDIHTSLAEKLITTGRIKLVEDAEEAKERAMKRIMKYQNSQTAQEIFAYTLSDIHSRFKHYIRPLIDEGKSRDVVDAAIFDSVVNPIASMAAPSNLGINHSMVDALLYFLAGNCYIKWN